MKRRLRGGMTLLEVVVAVTLLAGALFTLGILIPRSVLHLRNKGFETVAAQMAEQILDETRGLDQADVPNGTWDAAFEVPGGGVRTPDPPIHPNIARRRFPPAPYPAPGADPASVTVAVNGQPMTVTYWFVVSVSPDGINNTRKMTVTVKWKEPQGGGGLADRSWQIGSQLGQ